MQQRAERSIQQVKSLTARVRKPHIGKKPMKFYITCHDLFLELRQPLALGELFIVWRRGRKVVMSKPVRLNEELDAVTGDLTVTASWRSQDLALLCTIFLDSTRNCYEHKLSEFALTEVGHSGPREIASVSLDLSLYAAMDSTRTEIELPLPANGTIGMLRLTLVSRWLRNFAPDGGEEDGGASMISGLTGDSNSVGGLPGDDDLGLSLGGHMSAVDEVGLEKAHNERAIESMWKAHMALDPRTGDGAGNGGGATAVQLREKLGATQAELSAAQAEAKRLQAVLAKVADSHKAALSERVVELETRLARVERERADVEERIGTAFSVVIRDLELQISRHEAEIVRLRANAVGAGRPPPVSTAGGSSSMLRVGGGGGGSGNATPRAAAAVAIPRCSSANCASSATAGSGGPTSARQSCNGQSAPPDRSQSLPVQPAAAAAARRGQQGGLMGMLGAVRKPR